MDPCSMEMGDHVQPAGKRSPHSRASSEDSSRNDDRPHSGSLSSETRKSTERKRRSPASRGGSSGGDDACEQDKKSRREAANSNERRRMMSINNGFLNLQMLLPKHYVKRGEKMSKAAVLHSTVDYINKLINDHTGLQGQNKDLVQKANSTRLDSGGESNDETAEPESSGAKDLNILVEHWKAKYARERQLRAQTIEEFRRLILDAIQCCPSGFSKRETYNAALLRRSKSPTPGNDADFPFLTSQFSQITTNGQMPIKLEHGFAVPTAASPDSTGPVISIPELSGGQTMKRKGSPVGQEKERNNLKPLTGFDILYQAITFSENLDGSDLGSSQESLPAAPEPPSKKRRK